MMMPVSVDAQENTYCTIGPEPRLELAHALRCCCVRGMGRSPNISERYLEDGDGSIEMEEGFREAVLHS